MTPGVYDLTIEQYHNGPGISRSGIMEFKKSPLHFWHKYLNPEAVAKEPTDAMIFGNALHTYVLEPELFESRYHLWSKVNGRKPASNTKAWEEIEAQANGRILLCDEDVKVLSDMHRSINKSATARSVIEGGKKEKSIFWVDKDTGILCKVRPDVWHQNLVVDLKTAADASPNAFARSVYQFGYHVQCGMINEALHNLYGINMMNFVFPVVEKDGPYACGVYRMSDDAINQGRDEFKRALFAMKECMLTDTWEAYPDTTIDLPAYAYKNNEEI